MLHAVGLSPHSDFGNAKRRFSDTAMRLCFVFYLGGKVILCIVLCEFLRAIRHGIVDRCADIFGSGAFLGFLWPLAKNASSAFTTTWILCAVAIVPLVL